MTNADLATQMEIHAPNERKYGDAVERHLRDNAQEGPAAQRFDRTGSSGSDTSDPTAQAAMRAKPIGLDRDNLLAWERAGKQIADGIAVRAKLMRDNNPDSRKRPAATAGPCKGGTLHYPDEKGLKCAASTCGKAWPCKESETESHFDPCLGSVQRSHFRCGRCQLPADIMVCARCGEEKPSFEYRSHKCSACRHDIDKGAAA